MPRGIPMEKLMHAVKVVALVTLLAATAALTGCASHAERYRQGLQWHLDNEVQKAQLNAQGFPQYNSSE
jgi:hypothetical protein